MYEQRIPRTEISDKLLKLKNCHEQRKYCQVFLSAPLIRGDSEKATSVIASLREQLLNLNIKLSTIATLHRIT